MLINVRYPKLKQSYGATAKLNQNRLIDKMEQLVVSHERASAHQSHQPNSVSRGGSLRKKKIQTFALK